MRMIDAYFLTGGDEAKRCFYKNTLTHYQNNYTDISN